MRKTGQRRVVGLLGVGFDHKDEQIRITQSKNYQILMGSNSSHHALQKICSKIDQAIQSSNRVLNDYTPEEFIELMQKIT